MLSNKMQIEYLHPGKLKDHIRQLRTPTDQQIAKTIRLIEEFGIPQPVVIDQNNTIIIGWHFVEAARQMKLGDIPIIRADHLDEHQVRALRVAYDRIAEEAKWNKEELAKEFLDLEVHFDDLTITGFDIGEIDLTLDIIEDDNGEDDITPHLDGPTVTQTGDVWILGNHRLICGDALEEETYKTLLQDERAQMCITDAPYNVKIDAHVLKLNKTKHPEFEMASGEMTPDEFTEFLTTPHQHMATYSKKGALVFSCMDWRHIPEIMAAATKAELSMINLCVWVKDNGGMGSLYRSQHELVFVFKNGDGKHINNVELGKHGRYRTNVWQYAGANSFSSDRMNDLEMHPTVKPVAMFMDAIKDCSRRNGIVLDPFGGSGTTLIAAEKAGRKARLIEISPHYCDVTIRRWQALKDQDAIHASTGKTFNETENMKGKDNE